MHLLFEDDGAAFNKQLVLGVELDRLAKVAQCFVHAAECVVGTAAVVVERRVRRVDLQARVVVVDGLGELAQAVERVRAQQPRLQTALGLGHLSTVERFLERPRARPDHLGERVGAAA